MNIKLFWDRYFAVPSFPPTWIIFQRLAGLLAFAFLKLKIHPNLVTIGGAVLGTYSCYNFIFYENIFFSSIKLAILFSIVYILDCTDGQVARASNRSSLIGKYLDLLCDFYINIIFPLSIGYYLYLLFPYKIIFVLILLLVVTRNLLLFLFAIQRSNGKIHSPASSNVKKIVQILYDTPIFYIIVCFARINTDVLLAVIVFYLILYMVTYFYKRRYSV